MAESLYPTEPLAGEFTTTSHANKKVSKASSSYLIFLVIVFIILSFILGVLIANTYYFSELKNNDCGKVTKGESNTMYYLNLVLSIVAALLWLVIIFLFFFGFTKPEITEKYIGTYKRPTAVTSAQETLGEYKRRVGVAGTILRTGTPPAVLTTAV